ncbi:hypothetical protein MettiDRAFT_2690 [Methanolobus tindarius DSM 2278]|jgi:hypothetical protein|uniref:Uncharacterized protein n=1 Tax=Methanolobus tindarius DSM 2278 TaxID=1090322 RepID=W9E0Q5_METTI|nr:hypothetical protein MettiDRAFT_2690 [Methanolobus tindarius DSM 2278]
MLMHRKLFQRQLLIDKYAEVQEEGARYLHIILYIFMVKRRLRRTLRVHSTYSICYFYSLLFFTVLTDTELTK